MKRNIIVGSGILLAISISLALFLYAQKSANVESGAIEKSVLMQEESAREQQDEEDEGSDEEIVDAIAVTADDIHQPLDRASERITKKPFGILIDPATSPIQPERFNGYHAGTDFEVFEDELTEEVLVYALCDGEILTANKVDGYGGVIVQSCMFGDQSVRVLYGHVSMGNSLVRVGDSVVAGDTITALGKHESDDTDGERKHLHLGIVRGDVVDLRGYVQNEKDLSRWIDFANL